MNWTSGIFRVSGHVIDSLYRDWMFILRLGNTFQYLVGLWWCQIVGRTEAFHFSDKVFDYRPMRKNKPTSACFTDKGRNFLGFPRDFERTEECDYKKDLNLDFFILVVPPNTGIACFCNITRCNSDQRKTSIRLLDDSNGLVVATLWPRFWLFGTSSSSAMQQ